MLYSHCSKQTGYVSLYNFANNKWTSISRLKCTINTFSIVCVDFGRNSNRTQEIVTADHCIILIEKKGAYCRRLFDWSSVDLKKVFSFCPQLKFEIKNLFEEPESKKKK